FWTPVGRDWQNSDPASRRIGAVAARLNVRMILIVITQRGLRYRNRDAWYIGAHGTKNILSWHVCAPSHAFNGGCRSTVRPNPGDSAHPHQAKRDGFCLDGLDDFF